MRVLGVDGGQSGIRMRHSLGDRTAEVEGVSRQDGDTIGSVVRAVSEGWGRLGSPATDRVVLGLTTAPADATGSDRLSRLVGDATGASEVWLTDDAVTSHVGALSGCPGVSLVAGTGVACLALPPVGEPKLIGGHGYLLGDEGGGFWIGRRGLGAVLRAREGRGPTTALSEHAERRFGPLDDLHVRLHDAERPVHAIAEFAPDVFEAAVDGDAVAEAILDEAAQELMTLAAAGAAWVGVEAPPLALGGRLLASQSELRRRLDLLLAVSPLHPGSRDAAGTALDGALALGLSTDPNRYRTRVHIWQAGAGA
jgi:N-acetylglucosamine kinase-like BadF-type ATPase